MRILHTADWHVGKTLKGRPRLDEHERVLREIVEIARREQVDLVLVAGDLYDTAAPNAAAQRLVVKALLGLASRAQVVAIAGNHDHGPMLDAYRPLASAAGITLVGAARTAADGGVVELTAGGERAVVAALPFLSQRYAVSAAELVSRTPGEHASAYDQQVRDLLTDLASGFRTDAVNLVTAHLTCINGLRGGGEREAQSIMDYAVPAAAVFPADAHYVALGHLHRRQRMAAPCPVHYSGAPLAVDFGEQENEPVVCLVEASPGTPAKVTDIPVTTARRLRTLRGTVAELAAMADEVGEDWVRVYVREPARAGLRDDVVAALPNALEVRIDPEFAAPAQDRPRPSGGPDRQPAELFHEYLSGSGVADARVEKLFVRLLDDVSGPG
ncbi:MAG: exonuclease SbcCD subunit D [Pseudonocardia sp.]